MQTNALITSLTTLIPINTLNLVFMNFMLDKYSFQ